MRKFRTYTNEFGRSIYFSRHTAQIEVAHILRLSNAIFTEQIVVRYLTSELWANIEWEVSEAEFSFQVSVRATLLEMIR